MFNKYFRGRKIRKISPFPFGLKLYPNTNNFQFFSSEKNSFSKLQLLSVYNTVLPRAEHCFLFLVQKGENFHVSLFDLDLKKQKYL